MGKAFLAHDMKYIHKLFFRLNVGLCNENIDHHFFF